MKWMIIAVLIFAQQPTKPPEGKGPAEGKGAQVSKQADRGDNQEQTPKRMPSSPADNQHPSAEMQSAASKTSDDAEIQGKIKTFTGLLVVVGFLQFFALIGQVVIYCRQARIMAQQRNTMLRQWRAMREQVTEMRGQVTEMKEQTDILEKSVKATQDNASAAKASADALVNAERAWIMAQIKWSAEVSGLANPTQLRVVEGNGSEGETLSVDICLIYSNDGRTPAWIMERRILFRQVELLAVPPQFEVDIIGDYRLIGPEPVTVGGQGKIRAILTCHGHREQGKALVVYGFIKYRDVFIPERETRFGYVITPDNKFQRIAGLGDFWQYNNYT